MVRDTTCEKCNGTGVIKKGEWSSVTGLTDKVAREDVGAVSCPQDEISLQQDVLRRARTWLAGSDKQLERFLRVTRDYGCGKSRATVYFSQLCDIFGLARTNTLLPDLARLLKHDERRRELLRCQADCLDLDTLTGLKDEARDDMAAAAPPPVPTPAPTAATRTNRTSEAAAPLPPPPQ